MAKLNIEKVNKVFMTKLYDILEDFGNKIKENESLDQKDLYEIKFETMDKISNVMEALSTKYTMFPVQIFYVAMSEDDEKEFNEEYPDAEFPAELYAEIYTDGLYAYDHPEICITIPINRELVHSLMSSVISTIADDEDYFLKLGVNNDILENFSVMILEGKVTERLYMILPDKNNKFPTDEDCDESFKHQIEVMEFIEEYKKEYKKEGNKKDDEK